MAGLVLPLLLAEGILQLLDKPSNVEQVGWKYQGERVNEVNELGFRGKSITYNDDDTVILLIGDSQVEADGVAFQEMPENLLQHHLGNHYKVFTIGASGYGNDQQLIALQAYFSRYRADQVVLWQTFDNDLWNNTFPTHIPHNGKPKPTFRLENERLIGPLTDFANRYTSSVKLMFLINRTFGDGADDEWETLLPMAYRPSYLWKGDADSTLDPQFGGSLNEDFSTEKNHYAVRFFPKSARTDYSIALTHMLLHEIKELATANGATCRLFNVDLKDFNPRFSQDTTIYVIGENYYFSSLTQRLKNMKKTNEGLDWFSIGVYHDQWSISGADPHLNASTNDEVMHILADSLR